MPIVRGGYGKDLYNSGDFGTEGVIHDGSALISATPTVLVVGNRLITSECSITSTTSVISNAIRKRENSASISATVATVASGEGIIREDSDKYAYGTGLYGSNEYDQADLQTIVSATSAVANVSALRVQNADAISTASTSITASSERIHQPNAISFGVATTTASAIISVVGSANSTVTSSVNINYVRKRNAGALVSTTSSTLAIGREKWEVVSPTGATWTTISETTNTWTTIAA